MLRIDDHWEYTSTWTQDFLEGAPGETMVRLPHTNAMLPLHYADNKSYQKVVGYRRQISIPDYCKGKRYFLQFDGAAHVADVWFNGTHVATHRCGYTAFRVEITEYLKPEEENFVTVRLDSRESLNIPPFGYVVDYLTYGGLYRHVWLDETPAYYPEEVFITTPDLNTCQVELAFSDAPSLEEQKKNTLHLEIQTRDTKECIIAKDVPAESGIVSITTEDVEPWTLERPQLYTLSLSLDGWSWEITFGYRTISMTENQLLLNGAPLFIRGLNRHQSYPYVGYAVSDSMQVEDARILKEELHVNLVRTSHYPQSQAFIDACDALGLLVFTEIPGWQHIGDAEWKQQACENTKEMILQYRNHPSIILWGVRINESLDDDALYEVTNRIAHDLDPSRPTTGVRYLEKSSLLEDVYSFNDFSHEGNNPGCKNKSDVTADTTKPLLITEANGHMFPTKSFDPWQKRQEHALRHGRVLDAAMADGMHAGAIQWCMFDYPTHQEFGSGDRMCYHGVMDFFRNPKLAAALYASQQDTETILELSSPMDIGDYAASRVGSVYAFTNADSIRLYRNEEFVAEFTPKGWQGLAHGPIQIDDFIGCLLEKQEGYTGAKERLIHSCLLAAGKHGMANLPLSYKAKFAWGMLRYGMNFEEGKALFSKYIDVWGDEGTSWKFEAIKDGSAVKAITRRPSCQLHMDVKTSSKTLLDTDTYDMALVRIRILDDCDMIASYAQIPLALSTTGPIELVGPSVVTAEGGMCGTFIRSTGTAGDATLQISGEGLEPVIIPFGCKTSH